ncbi:peptide/nickel transport system ATP-binding protein/oligopeptide transport system ATP-binding protein [Stella humosa]|uniref:Peptide/nickel transport system ATP-binding protein/oligopeptide transport system ATP-binding protein n=1 Tax=Stella humosa TaxID=94 RepID=A0A3N1M8N6_9PROT|nr:ABC transporter ATP-binding protein [Stella humosa]ROQ00038.1 peptide/nickel transport system ATP-binding protein/oligopeptide transport system ATP-binding protein [Stella humosa]BBK30730.1 ABC transporter ATP-binding protein [Stella humosa]
MASLLEIENLSVRFPAGGAVVQAVDGVSYSVDEGETVAVVGESGCGKSVHALAMTGLVPRPPAIIGGAVRFAGRDLATLEESELRRIRGPGIGMVFQEPMTSLNPLMTVGRQLTEHMRTHLGLSRRAARDRAVELLGLVGIGEPAARLDQYPHHFSGGMRQRVMIAIALACRPRLIIADEPTTALDVTIQAQILKLMKELTREMGVALVIITHNLGLVARYADRVNVMYAGRIVEHGRAADIFADPRHPYTRGLLASVPRLDRPRTERLVPIDGQPPDLSRLDGGCSYRPRCGFVTEACARSRPALEPAGAAHAAACFHPGKMPAAA